MDYEHTLIQLEEIVRSAGKISRERFENLREEQIQTKADNSLVTDADIEINTFIQSALQKLFPSIGILSEEASPIQGASEYVWVVDPIDGTKNFVERNQNFAISIGLLFRDTPELGIVYAPMTNQMFTAYQGHGAYKNNERIRVSTQNTLHKARILIDHGTHPASISIHGNIISELSIYECSCTGTNCASLELCMVAAGEADAFVHRRLHPWDIAAGMIIAKEAGAVITDLRGKPKDIYAAGILVSTTDIHSELSRITSKALDEFESSP